MIWWHIVPLSPTSTVSDRINLLFRFHGTTGLYVPEFITELASWVSRISVKEPPLRVVCEGTKDSQISQPCSGKRWYYLSGPQYCWGISLRIHHGIFSLTVDVAFWTGRNIPSFPGWVLVEVWGYGNYVPSPYVTLYSRVWHISGFAMLRVYDVNSGTHGSGMGWFRMARWTTQRYIMRVSKETTYDTSFLPSRVCIQDCSTLLLYCRYVISYA